MAFRAPEYERFEGPRTGMPAWWPIWRATFKRGWRSKWIRWLTIASFLPAAGLTIVIYLVQSYWPEMREMLEQAQEGNIGGPNFKLDASVYLILLHVQVYAFLFPLSLLLGYDLLSGDLRSNALESYFSRPITPWGYVFGRTVAFTAFLLLATLAPMLWVWGLDVATAPDGHFEKIKQVPLGLAAAMTLVAVTMAIFVQALTSITKSGLWTAMVVAILFTVSSFLGEVLFELTNIQGWRAVAFWENIYVLANGFLGYPGETYDHVRFGLSFTIVLVLLGASLLLLMRRVKKGALVG